MGTALLVSIVLAGTLGREGQDQEANREVIILESLSKPQRLAGEFALWKKEKD